MKKQLIFLVFLLIIFSGNTFAENISTVPHLINYQGFLSDENGKGITGKVKIEFNIYKTSTGVTLLWGPQIFNSLPVVNGLFNVILGSTDAEEDSIATAFEASEAFLGMKVNDGVEITPRQKILSVPYAMNSLNSVNSVNSETSKKADYAIKADFATSTSKITTNNFGGYRRMAIYNKSGSYIGPNLKEEEISYVWINCFGAGGGGGGEGGGGGGSGGNITGLFVDVTNVSKIKISIGKGGTGGHNSGGNGSNGGDTIIDFQNDSDSSLKKIICYGGKGGKGKDYNSYGGVSGNPGGYDGIDGVGNSNGGAGGRSLWAEGGRGGIEYGEPATNGSIGSGGGGGSDN